MRVRSHRSQPINVIAYPLAPCSTIYPGHVYAGLCDLAAEGAIRLRFRPAPRLRALDDGLCDGSGGFARIAYVEARYGDVGPIRIMFDLYDDETLVSPHGAEIADLYFKRSYKQGGYGVENVLPYGLYYNVRSDREVQVYWRTLCAATTRGWLLSNPKKMLSVMRSASRFREFRLPVQATHAKPSDPASLKVLLQTRLFSPTTLSFRVVNAERIRLVRALKEGLQQSFVGGIINSRHAQEICPDLISSEASNSAGYLALMRRTLIGVSMRGLDNSTPCKIAEYLAMSRCVVSQPLRDELPVPLREGIELHTFRSDAEAVQVCQRLLQNPDHVQASRQAAHDYFVNHASPRESVRRCLGLAIEHAGRTPQF